MTSPRDEALTLLRKAREEVEGVSAHLTRQDRSGDLDTWARVQHATNVVEALLAQLSTLASYEFARIADDRKVSMILAEERQSDRARDCVCETWPNPEPRPECPVHGIKINEENPT